MNQPLRFTSCASLVVLASMVGGCAVPQARVGAAAQVGSKAEGDAGLGIRALAALNSGNATLAIDLAERAVARTPVDAAFRVLLGNAYFAGGRFRSAESAFRDALTLDANQPQVVLKLALVEIAQGKNGQAIQFLNTNRGALNASDYGLALALAGRPAEAVTVLEPAARSRDADATVRQNLALAYAFSGDWTRAKVIAGQDVPANQLDARMDQWMRLATPQHAADQVAALVGVTPAAADAGQPVQLALNKSETRQAEAAPIAAPEPVAVPAPPVQTAQAPAPQPTQPALAEAPAPVAIAAPAVSVPPAPPPARSTLATLASAAVDDARAVLAKVMPASKPTPASYTKRLPPLQPAVAHRGNASAVVQLGAYNSADRVLTAWNGAAAKYAMLKGYAPMSARFASSKGTFYRLSVRGFSSVGEANALCASLRRAGGSCFVRNVAGDRPVEIASR